MNICGKINARCAGGLKRLKGRIPKACGGFHVHLSQYLNTLERQKRVISEIVAVSQPEISEEWVLISNSQPVPSLGIVPAMRSPLICMFQRRQDL